RLHELDLGRDAACKVHAWRVQNFTDRHDRKIRASRGDHAGRVLAACRGLDVDLFRDAEPRKKIVHKPNTARASGDRDGFGLEQDLFEALDGAHVGLWSPHPHRHAEGYSRKIHVRSGGDSLRRDQLLRPSLERITTSAGTPRASCAAIVCGPVPCDAPDPVVTLMPLVRSNSGNSCSYSPLNPPDIKTFNCADAATG